MSPISRTQALAKVTILVIDRNLPAPSSIDFQEEGPCLQFATLDDVTAWASALDGEVRSHTAPNGVAMHTGAADWQGMRVVLVAYVHPQRQAEPVAEDMSRVRAVAEHGEDEPRCPDPECEEPLALIASGAVGHCGRSCAPLDEETARVEEDAAELASYRREAEAEHEAERRTPTDDEMDEAIVALAAHLDAERAEEQLQDWYFTFGYDHAHAGEPLRNRYVRIHGTCDSTRDAMFAAFGNRWAFQYPANVKAERIDAFGMTEIGMPAVTE